ncbi:hypothetical protein [Kineococcus indalonis]|uniref:hypothetical protein n=1 Tax=Kineococcus indalonis TaxID=2696566 RepID=UPI0014134EE8|nr:hypothetical protein [Kineococcus indalonis]NAZ84774.1 hypothetical protein [Kineococcus indalonis]
MSRLIDIDPDHDGVPAELVLTVGDVVRFNATGVLLRSGSSVEVVGILIDSVVGADGSVLTPLGVPNTVLLKASAPGESRVDVVSGDPFGPSTSRSVLCRVQGPPAAPRAS